MILHNHFSCSRASKISRVTDAFAELGSLCRFLRVLDVCKMRHLFAGHFAESLFKSSYNQLLNSHDSEASHIAKYGYSLTCPVNVKVYYVH